MFEKFQNMSDEAVKDCPSCGKDVRRIINGGSGVIFKGSGFYKTDSKGTKQEGTSTKKDGQTDAAPCPAAESGACAAAKASPAATTGTAKESA
jgi:putative FmdB family regulatory protein